MESTRRAVARLRRSIQVFLPFDLLIDTFVRLSVTYGPKGTGVNSARFGETDDPKGHPIPMVVKETIVSLIVRVVPLARLRSGKLNNRVPKPPRLERWSP